MLLVGFCTFRSTDIAFFFFDGISFTFSNFSLSFRFSNFSYWRNFSFLKYNYLNLLTLLLANQYLQSFSPMLESPDLSSKSMVLENLLGLSFCNVLLFKFKLTSSVQQRLLIILIQILLMKQSSTIKISYFIKLSLNFITLYL